jgi:hypothetical protein
MSDDDSYLDSLTGGRPLRCAETHPRRFEPGSLMKAERRSDDFRSNTSSSMGTVRIITHVIAPIVPAIILTPRVLDFVTSGGIQEI